MTFDEFVQKARDYQDSRVLLSGIELDLFSAIGDGASAGEVAAARGTDPRATGLLLNALVAVGALVKSGDRFQVAPGLAPHLGNARHGLMHTVNMWRTWSTLSEAVRAGTAVIEPGVEQREPGWMESFIAAMHRNAQVHARRMVDVVGARGVRRILDIGGGSGAYSIAFAAANPALEAEVFDLPEVTTIARRHIEAEGLTDRVKTRDGDLRTSTFGTGYDLVLLSAICHMLGEEENVDLLQRCFRATASGGRLVIREFILDSSGTAPKDAALFALNMLVGTRSGRSYSEDEYREWLQQAGYQAVDRPGGGDLMIASRR
jgi:predicted O-methyltransferase YrrM